MHMPLRDDRKLAKYSDGASPHTAEQKIFTKQIQLCRPLPPRSMQTVYGSGLISEITVPVCIMEGLYWDRALRDLRKGRKAQGQGLSCWLHS